MTIVWYNRLFFALVIVFIKADSLVFEPPGKPRLLLSLNKWNILKKNFVYCSFFNFMSYLFESKNPDSWHPIHVYTPIIKVLCHYLDNKCLEWKENRHMGKKSLVQLHVTGICLSYQRFWSIQEGAHCTRRESLLSQAQQAPSEQRMKSGHHRSEQRKCVVKGTWCEPVILKSLR